MTTREIKYLGNLCKRDEFNVRIKHGLSKERIVTGLKSLGKLRIKTSHDTMITFSAFLLILFIAFTIRLFPMRWETGMGTMHLSEFDPYYQYSLTEYMVENGLISPYWPIQWQPTDRWYPNGINMGRSLPALPMTTAFIYIIISALGVTVPLMSFCALFPAIMGMLSCLIIYFLGKDIGGKSMGLFAALFLALAPSFIQRTSLGFFDDETIGIFALILFAFLFLRAIEEERSTVSTVKYALASGAALGYFCAGWGAAYYIIGVTVLFVFSLILLKRYTQRLLLSYCLTFGLGLFIAINVPSLSTRYLTTFIVLPVAGMFALLCTCEAFRAFTSAKWKVVFVVVVLALLVGSFVLLWQLGYVRGVAGKFITVLDPTARAGSPLVESVAEHRISAWGSIYYEFGVVIIFFLVSLFFILRNLNTKNLFLLILGLTSLYFACSMVRLLVLMAPAFSILASLGITRVLKPFNTLLREPPKISVKKKYGLQHVGKEFSGAAVFLIFLVLMTNFAFPMPRVYRQAWSPVTITASSLPIAPNKPVYEWLEMLNWMRSNLEATDVVCSWWDYGYWLTMMGNVTSLADNATINGTQIENIGFIFMANETNALKMLELYDTKYILVFTTLDTNGNWLGYGDEGKWMWMARISGKARDRFVPPRGDFLDEQSAWVDEEKFGNFTDNKWIWNDVGKNSTIYTLMSYGKHQWLEKWRGGQDPDTYTAPEYLKQAYFAGLSLSPSDAGEGYYGIVPLICLYEIDWQKYHNDFSS